MLLGYSSVFISFFSHPNAGKSCYAGSFLPQKNAVLSLLSENLLAANGNFVQELLQNKLSHDALYVACVSNAVAKKINVIGKPETGSLRIISSPQEFFGSRFVEGKIMSNFYSDARKLGVPATVVDNVIHNLSAKVDFKHSLKRGDVFEIIYSPKNVMLYAKIITKRSQTTVYRFTTGANSAYFFENGAKVAARTNSNSFAPPLKGKLHVSSAFGSRVHPIRGVYQRHTGVDLSAPHGTPVYAVFDGVVTRASPYYGYGNCIDVRHSSGYSSRYGHLSRYAVRSGAKVKRNQLIGYIGSTGTSTGAHLHLELARNNRVINPLSVKMLPDEVSSVPNMKNFNILKEQIEKLRRKKTV
jgi:murein DD-endopeptidase MepM/ murein hydrolase activator NlpD